MLLLSSPRSGRLRRAALLPLTAVLLCVSVSVSAGLPALFYPDLDEEIDLLKSIIEKQSQRVSEHQSIKAPNKQTKYLALVTSEQRFKNSKAVSSHRGQKSNVEASSVTQAPDPAVTAVTNTPTSQPKATGVVGRGGHIMVPAPENDKIIIIMISLCVTVGTVAVILATVCYIKLQKESRLARKVDYPAFGGAAVPAAVTTGTTMGDKSLAQNAQMYHYQHQKQQMLSMGNHKPEQNAPDNEVTSDEEEVGGDFTVYECPGLAPTGEMEVKNPLFDDSALHYQGNHK